MSVETTTEKGPFVVPSSRRGGAAVQYRHAETDARWYAYDAGEELVLVYPDSRFKVMAVITASRALELIKEADPQLLMDAILEEARS